jgi:aldose sugar dehydrogenase
MFTATMTTQPAAAPRLFLALLTLGALAACGRDDADRPASAAATTASPSVADSIRIAPTGAASAVGAPAALRVDTIATGLEVPWGMAFAPDGRIFVTERAGRIRVIENGRLRETPLATLPVYATEPGVNPESGLMGIALAPDFATSGHIYVLGTFWRSDAARSRSIGARVMRRIGGLFSGGARWENRIYRLTARGADSVEARVIVDDLPGNYYHAGGGLEFGPDGMLYATIGDVLEPERAHDRDALAGKVLRYRPDGTVPDDNPFRGSPVYAMGLRNVQALAWHPRTGELFAADHGPSGMPQEQGRQDRDELNVIAPGGDYGWPEVAGLDSGAERYRRPIAVWTPAIVPSGMAFYTGPDPAWGGELFLGGLRGARLTRLTLAREPGAGWRVVAQDSALLAGAVGRIRALRMGPDGHIYFTTSNHDGRGTPRPSDDMLLRLVPVR